MGLSAHQYRFLKACGVAGSGKKTSRKVFESLYSVRNIKGANVVKYVTETLERLIDHGFMIGHGTRTPHKWYITDVKLTREGARAVREYEKAKQRPLPIKMRSARSQKPQNQESTKKIKTSSE